MVDPIPTRRRTRPPTTEAPAPPETAGGLRRGVHQLRRFLFRSAQHDLTSSHHLAPTGRRSVSGRWRVFRADAHDALVEQQHQVVHAHRLDQVTVEAGVGGA